ncbi:hypothetical protein MTR67_019113 [Solanum verrucosum]|uniref:Uncharacterized protein n=1 Tax=Solanum verrucosum TaxID=315347 RepID=A0AAF0QNV8_SOLVR|nr:hypothetical protein MTR67_019113 [Solanum verrucosum]
MFSLERMKKTSMIKRRWNPKEDELLQKLVKEHGAENWSLIGQLISSQSGKLCRFRWCNQLNPQVDHRLFTLEEDNTIIRAHAKIGLSRLRQLSLYPSSTPLGEILTLLSMAPVTPDPSTHLSHSLPGFKSSKDLNLVNQIE